MDLSARSPRLEIMDTTPLASAEMERTLDFLSLTNKWFGGARVITRQLDEWFFHDTPQTQKIPKEREARSFFSVLDVGTGAADIPIALVAWAKKRGLRVRVTGLDLVPGIVEIARERTKRESDIDIRRGDLFELAESSERFDFVIASLFLHHMPGEQASRALRAFDRLARRGVIVSDLIRSRFGFAAVALASYVFGNRVVRHDGPLSVARSFRPEELQQMARELGLDYLTARGKHWCRLMLAGQKS